MECGATVSIYFCCLVRSRFGSYLINEWDEVAGSVQAMAENSEILMDGQQRLHSLEEYFLDRLAVPDVQGLPRVWSEIGKWRT